MAICSFAIYCFLSASDHCLKCRAIWTFCRDELIGMSFVLQSDFLILSNLENFFSPFQCNGYWPFPQGLNDPDLADVQVDRIRFAGMAFIALTTRGSAAQSQNIPSFWSCQGDTQEVESRHGDVCVIGLAETGIYHPRAVLCPRLNLTSLLNL